MGWDGVAWGRVSGVGWGGVVWGGGVVGRGWGGGGVVLGVRDGIGHRRRGSDYCVFICVGCVVPDVVPARSAPHRKADAQGAPHPQHAWIRDLVSTN